MSADLENADPLSDRQLGMDRRITRRDFLNGAAMTFGAAAVPAGALHSGAQAAEPQNHPGYNPPVATGMRGSHPGSFEIAHSLRDGTFWKTIGKLTDTGDVYDLIVVGGGISGLSAAYFFRQRNGPNSRILILENHDDFGGHARRNEFRLGGKLQLLNGGTMLIDSPTAYSKEAAELISKLGIDPVAFENKYPLHDLYRSLSLGPAIFFDKQTFGEDRLVASAPSEWGQSETPSAKAAQWLEFLNKTPLADVAKRDILRLETGTVDTLPGLSSAEKKDKLSRVSYKDFLLTIAKVDPAVVSFYQTRTNGEWGVGIDAEPALDCWALGLPGFQGMNLDPGPAPRMSYSAAGYSTGGSARFHFPDGNATIARLLVRELIPEAMPGHSVEDVVTSQVAYDRLDHPTNTARIRLNSTVVRVQNVADTKSSQGVIVAYAEAGKVFTARAKGCVLACWNMTIPYLCPDLPEKQKDALHFLVKVPLVYTSVGLRNWTAFQKLGVYTVHAPGSYWNSFNLNWPVDIGGYKSPRSPNAPILVHMGRTPCKPGFPAREQHKAGRMELLVTPFETFERNVRDQLARCLGAGGFDPARDIEAITVNRWPHGYGYEYNPLFDPQWAPGQAPHEIGRKPQGRITIANSDSGATAYTDVAIDQAFRAVSELFER